MFSRHARTSNRKPVRYRGPFQFDNGNPLGDWRKLKRFRGDKEEFQFPGKRTDPWPARHDEELQRLKRAVDEDPYGMVFGRRLLPFPFGQNRGPWSTFFHDILGFDGSGSAPPKQEPIRVQPSGTERVQATKAQAQAQAQAQADNPPSGPDSSSTAMPKEEPIPGRKTKTSETPAGQAVLFQFDAISGRMVPKEPQPHLKQESVPKKAHGAESQKERMEAKSKSSTVGSDRIKTYKSSYAKEQAMQGGKEPKSSSAVDTSKTGKSSTNEIKNDTLVFTGAPREKTYPSAAKSSSSSTGQATAETKEKTSSKPSPTAQGGGKTSKKIPWTHPQAFLGDFKDYVTSKLDVKPETPDTKGWPYFRRQSSPTASFRDGPLADTNYRKDPEAEDIEKLRPKDVRASFQQRELERGEAAQAREEPEEDVEEPVRLDEPFLYGRELEHEKSDEAARARDEPEVVEEPVRLDEPFLYGASNPTAQWGGSKQHSSASKDNANHIDVDGANKAEGAAILSTDWGVLEEQIRQVYEETQGKTVSAEKPAQTGQAEEGKGKVAAVSTDSPPVDTIDMAAQSALANKTEASASPQTEENPVLLQARRDEIDRLMMDIERANDAAIALLVEIKDGVQGKRMAEEQLEKAKVEATPRVETTPVCHYKVLAYDVMSREVKDASMISGSAVSLEPIHPADAISRLDSPAKFLPYISKMEAQGYELFSGGREVLVFKKMRDGTKDTIHSPGAAARLEQEAIDEMESVTNPQPAFSPTADPHSSPDAASVSSSSSSFSREKEEEKEKKKDKTKSSHRIRKVARRMALVGAITGGSVYAIGVVGEYFRTGGQDGLGPRGLTGLERR